MSYYERINLASLFTSALVIGWYAFEIIPQTETVPVSEIAFAKPMIVAVVIGVVLSIATSILVSVGSAIWIAAREGEEAVNAEMGSEDERDKQIGRLGDAWGGYVLGFAVVGAMVLIWMEFETFYVANTLFIGAWLSAVVGTIIKVFAYRRGF